MRGPHDLHREIERDNMRRIGNERTARILDQPLHYEKRCRSVKIAL